MEWCRGAGRREIGVDEMRGKLQGDDDGGDRDEDGLCRLLVLCTEEARVECADACAGVCEMFGSSPAVGALSAVRPHWDVCSVCTWPTSREK